MCQLYNIDPNGSTTLNGVTVPTILCHSDSNKLGLGTAHSDVLHWFPKFGKSMDTVRSDVASLLNSNTNVTQTTTTTTTTSVAEEDDEDMTQEKFNEMINTYLAELAKKEPSSWSADARNWCESNGIINGDSNGNKMYKKFLTREEMAAIIYRVNGQK